MVSNLCFGFDYLYECCLYSSILHAFTVLRYPVLASSQSWDNANYSFQFDNARGTVSFDFQNRIAAGAMRSEVSQRISIYPKHNSIELFDESTEIIKELASNEALQYLIDGIGGVEKSIATTALWSQNDQLMIYNDRDDFRKNGGQFVYEILLPHEDLREYWNEEHGYSPFELDLSEHLFELAKQRTFTVASDLLAFVDKEAEGYSEFLVSLGEIGFIFL